MKLYQEKIFLCIEYLALFIAFTIGIIAISLFYQNIYIVLFILIIAGLMAFPILFCYPKKIFVHDDKIIILTKLYKYKVFPYDVVFVKETYARGGVAYKLRTKKFFRAFYLHSHSFGYDNLINFIDMLYSFRK